MKNITEKQRNRLDELQEKDPDLLVEWDDDQGVASRIRGELSQGDEPGDLVREFLEEFGLLFGPPNLAETLAQEQTQTDDLGWAHLEYRQLYDRERELELEGATLAAHVDDDGELVEVQSSCWRDLNRIDLDPSIDREELAERLDEEIRGAPRYQEVREQMEQRSEWPFPVLQEPRLVVYPWQGGFRLAWTTYAYGVVEEEDVVHRSTGGKRLDLGKVFVDANTGEVFLFAPTSHDAETADTGSGLAVTPLGGPFDSRNLNIVRVDDSSTYRLKDTTHGRDIITYDAENSNDFDTDSERRDGINDGTLPVSEDTDGDKDWDRTPSDTSVSERTVSQQPEVDLHHFAKEAYEWYEALAGGTRDGWDDNQYSDPPVPDQTINCIAHARDGADPSSINAGARKRLVDGDWLSWIQFYDGDATTYSYLSGSKFIVGHEYQHHITDFSFEDGSGNPGLLYDGWLAAVHEGLSDVFGGLFAEQWETATEIAPDGTIFRNLVYPRDPDTFVNEELRNSNKDHFADRDDHGGFRYDRGTIIAHCSYLMGSGGVQERSPRSPTLIPVYTLGKQTYGGMKVLNAARIWYRALTYYFSTHGALTGIPDKDEDTFRTLRNGCVSAAEDIYGAGSREHRNTVLAFYAVGLHPTDETYGADPTFLRWGWSWRRSRPYIGISSPNWASVDLFINNGGSSEWNAQINVLDSDGDPTEFENDVYCRVRNVGDQAANDVTVSFEYAKMGTGPTSWQTVTDKDGNPQTLNLGTLAAGTANFPDSDQNSPPDSARIDWYIPPLDPSETVDHFCLRATVSASNDVNSHNNEVQSNIQYVPYSPGTGLSAAFMAGNPTEEEVPLDLRVETQLPEQWNVKLPDEVENIQLEPGEEQPSQVRIDMPPGADRQLEPPFDGEVRGELFGSISGEFTGTLTETSLDDGRLEGQFAATVDEFGTLSGGFEGRVNVLTGELTGQVVATLQCDGKEGQERICTGVRGCLRPLRRVEIGQFVNDEAIGGVTVQVQVPLPDGPCAEEFPDPPTTETRVTQDGVPKSDDESTPHDEPLDCSEEAEDLLDCLGVSGGDVSSVRIAGVDLDIDFEGEAMADQPSDENAEDSPEQVELAISELHVDAESDEYENLTDEYVEFENTGETEIELTGWTVEDEAGHVFVFPKGITLGAGATIKLRTGNGSNTESDIYWGSNQPIWNNRDDTVSVYDNERNLIVRRSY